MELVIDEQVEAWLRQHKTFVSLISPQNMGLKASRSATASCLVLDEPPDADLHVPWCERRRVAPASYSILAPRRARLGKSESNPSLLNLSA